MIKMDGLDDACVGVLCLDGKNNRLVYIDNRIVDILVKRDGMDQEEAWEYYAFNIERGVEYMSSDPGSPVIVSSRYPWESVDEMAERVDEF